MTISHICEIVIGMVTGPDIQSSIQTSEIFKALGHPARLEFVRMLADKERCVCELVDAVDSGWSTVSRHLSVLKETGIIEDEKRGMQVFYHLKLPCVIDFINCLENGGCTPTGTRCNS